MKDRYKYKIFKVIEEIHAFTTGAYDCAPYEIDEKANWLKLRTENWQKSFVFTETFDTLVKSLAKFTLYEYNEYKNKRMSQHN